MVEKYFDCKAKAIADARTGAAADVPVKFVVQPESETSRRVAVIILWRVFGTNVNIAAQCSWKYDRAPESWSYIPTEIVCKLETNPSQLQSS